MVNKLLTIIAVGSSVISLSVVENALASKGKLAEAEMVKGMGLITIFLGSSYGIYELFNAFQDFLGVMMW